MPPNNQFPNSTPATPAASGVSPSSAQGSKSSNPAPTPKNPNSTQNSLLLSEVRDNMVIMADGTFRAVVACQSINFDLMSSREREGVEFSYQNFLNSLNHPVQILIRSQRVDIGPYIDKLVEIRRNQDNMLLNVLMDDYINFIDILSQEANIMDKSFFIAIPYYPQGDVTNLIEQGKGFFGKLMSKPKNTVTKIDTATYEKAKTEIKNRVDAVMAGLFQLGVQSVQLNTKKMGGIYYKFFNTNNAGCETPKEFYNVATTYVKKAPNEAIPPQPGGTV